MPLNAVILDALNAVILGLVPRICSGRSVVTNIDIAAGLNPSTSADPRDKPEDDVGTCDSCL
jgi:hypothetical protein